MSYAMLWEDKEEANVLSLLRKSIQGLHGLNLLHFMGIFVSVGLLVSWYLNKRQYLVQFQFFYLLKNIVSLIATEKLPPKNLYL